MHAGRHGIIATPFTASAVAAMPPPTVSPSSATATSESDTTIFVAALQGDIETLKSLLPTQANRATPENFTPLSLAVSAGHVEACRLLLREGASPDAQDKSGITALMHACMHGFAELTELLLRHGAKTELRNAEGQTAASLAARYGRPAGLGVLFRSDGSLVESRDGLGRTPLHWAAVSSHAPTVKYLLGKWKADVGTVDNNQDTPLHLIDAHAAVAQDLLLLLYHGSAKCPSLTARNAAGNTPAEAAAAAGAAQTAELMRVSVEDAEGGDPKPPEWLSNGGGHMCQNLYSFLLDSPMRRPPSRTPPPSWLYHIAASDVIFILAPVMPPVLMSQGIGILISLASGLGTVGLSSIIEHTWSKHHASPHRITGMSSVNACLLVGMVASSSYIFTTGLLPYASTNGAATSIYLCLIFLIGYWSAYFSVTTRDPGFVPGADPNDAEKYWAALEHLPQGYGTPEGVCERSELFIPPRAAYSKYSGGQIRLMDHDCPWVGRAIGKGNHLSFVTMITCGFLAVLFWICALFFSRPPPPYTTWYVAMRDGPPDVTRHANTVLCSLPLQVILMCMLAPLLIVHLYLAATNVTTKEHFKYQQRAQGTNLPQLPIPCSRHFSKYSPYHRGVIGNVMGFIKADRDEGIVRREHQGGNPGEFPSHVLPSDAQNGGGSGGGDSGGGYPSDSDEKGRLMGGCSGGHCGGNSHRAYEMQEVRVEEPPAASNPKFGMGPSSFGMALQEATRGKVERGGSFAAALQEATRGGR